MKKGLLGYYNYTVVLTYIGMLTAFTGILMVLNKNFIAAVVCLLVSGVCDMFDGKVAATKERDHNEKCFGIQIDSLSDLVSFGIFPALFGRIYSLILCTCGSYPSGIFQCARRRETEAEHRT